MEYDRCITFIRVQVLFYINKQDIYIYNQQTTAGYIVRKSGSISSEVGKKERKKPKSATARDRPTFISELFNRLDLN
jgi:hypothetical protein